jgi:hypothetical protein
MRKHLESYTLDDIANAARGTAAWPDSSALH